MPEDLSVQILSQTSDNIQKLFDLSTRIDERVKSIQNNQTSLDDRMGAIMQSHNELMQTVAVLKSATHSTTNAEGISECKKEIVELDKRLSTLEHTSQGLESRWSQIFKFAINIIWLIAGAYLLYKLGLQPPAVP